MQDITAGFCQRPSGLKEQFAHFSAAPCCLQDELQWQKNINQLTTFPLQTKPLCMFPNLQLVDSQMGSELQSGFSGPENVNL